jgi:CheY-like chemotaxis protein
MVEDETVNRDLFRRRLERKGHAVIPAENGLTAVALARSEKPDLIIMDLGLPDIDGWEATRRIKADAESAAIPIIVLSAHAGTDAREKAFAAGCEEFETKPVNWEVLFRKIDEALAKAAERIREIERKKAEAEAAAKAAAQKAAVKDDDEIDFGGGGGPDPAAQTGVLKGKSGGTMLVEKDVCDVQPKHILVVEDNDANRVMLARRLNKHGYRTTEAADGRQALDAVTKHRFDLVLCDIMMPGVDGYEVLKEMKADPDLQAIPVIMVSALDEMASIVRCIELGAEDYLLKPYDPVLLHARINACLDKRRLRDQEMEFFRAVTELAQAAGFVERGKYDSSMVASVAGRADALGNLARVFDKMALEMQARVHQLQGEVQRLVSVDIDQKELTREVGRVTNSDEFRKARSLADAVRTQRQHRELEGKPGADTLVLPTMPKPK